MGDGWYLPMKDTLARGNNREGGQTVQKKEVKPASKQRLPKLLRRSQAPTLDQLFLVAGLRMTRRALLAELSSGH